MHGDRVMPGCCVPGCSGSHRKGQRMFRFPRDSGRRKAWEFQVKRDGWRPTDNSKVCELHFDQNQYEANRQDGRRLLKPTAVPLLFHFRSQPKCKKPPHQQTCPAPNLNDFTESSSAARGCASGNNGVSENQEGSSDCASESADMSSMSSSAAQECFSDNNSKSERHQEDNGDYMPGSADLPSVSLLATQQSCSGNSDSDMSELHQEGTNYYAAGSVNLISMSKSELVKEVLHLRQKNSVLQESCSEANKKLKRQLIKTKHLQKELSTVSSNLNIISEHIKVTLQKASDSFIPTRRASRRQKFL